jgi:bifunctional DNA-binding transcriptional regulator/antitoxin component of YhaV-PrlF toxin-antitoxin module
VLKAKRNNNEAITIPAKIAKKLALKDGSIIEARVEKGKLFILGKRDKTTKVMQYAGIWKNEKVDEVFREIRKEWIRWQKGLSV